MARVRIDGSRMITVAGALLLAGCGGHGGNGGIPPAGLLQFGQAVFTVSEGVGAATIAVSRVGGSVGTVSVSYATSDGTARAPGDYATASGGLVWGDGDFSDKFFTVPIVADTLAEGDESVNLTLSLPAGGAILGTPSTSLLMIADDDTPAAGALQFSAASTRVDEGAGSVTITVTRTGGSSGAISVSYATSDGTATQPGDYLAASGTLNWSTGDSSPKTFTVTLNDDAIPEPGGDETINLALTSATGGAIVGTQGTAVIAIVDNDSAGTLQFASATYSASEGVGMSGASITVTRMGGSDGAVSVQVVVAGGTATSGQDYPIFIDWVATLSWSAGDSAPKTFSFPLLDDSVPEGDETVILALTLPTGGATLGSPSSTTLTILDDDVSSPSGSLQFSSATYSFYEGAVPFLIPILPNEITVTRAGGSQGAVSVTVVVTGGTATADVDYMIPIPGPLPGPVLSWADGESGPKSFVITILDDLLWEGNETVLLGLTNVTGGVVLGSPKDSTVTIIDDEGIPIGPGPLPPYPQ